jgi:hypothetical protein
MLWTHPLLPISPLPSKTRTKANTEWFTISLVRHRNENSVTSGRQRHMNLYTSLINGESLGWAIFPMPVRAHQRHRSVEDGVVVRYDSGGDLFNKEIRPYTGLDTGWDCCTFDGLSCTGVTTVRIRPGGTWIRMSELSEM